MIEEDCTSIRRRSRGSKGRGAKFMEADTRKNAAASMDKAATAKEARTVQKKCDGAEDVEVYETTVPMLARSTPFTVLAPTRARVRQ